MGHLQKVAAELGLPWGMRTRTYNSRRAQELGKWAEVLGKGDEFHLAVFQAYFADGRNIADISVLKEIAGTIGLDGRMAEQALAERTFKEAVDRDWEYSRTCGITGFQLSWLVGSKWSALSLTKLFKTLSLPRGEYAEMMGAVQYLWFSQTSYLDVAFSHLPFDDGLLGLQNPFRSTWVSWLSFPKVPEIFLLTKTLGRYGDQIYGVC